MIKEFCDRCNAQVGNIGDGGKDVQKRQLSELLAVIGQKRDYIVCPRCLSELATLLTKYFTQRLPTPSLDVTSLDVTQR